MCPAWQGTAPGGAAPAALLSMSPLGRAGGGVLRWPKQWVPLLQTQQPTAPPGLSPPPLRCSGRWCVSDEHYVPTLLAMRGEETNCTCSQAGGRGSPTHTQWPGGPHPRTFYARELTRDGIRALRNCNRPSAAAALQGFRSMLPPAAKWNQQACSKAAAELGHTSMHLPGAVDSAAPGDYATAGPLQPLLPQFSCYLALRKVDPAAGPLLAQAVQQGLLDAG